jgi:hypothetical protein
MIPATSQTAEMVTDDALAEALADAWVERAAHDPALRRLALRAAGLAKEPADMTQEELAAEWHTDRHSLNRLALHALRKLRLSPEISAIKSQS